MRRSTLALIGLVTTVMATRGTGQESTARAFRFMTLDPGHFHAALVQREMYPDVSPRVDVYAPLGDDLIGHLKRVASFNGRTEQPTSWQEEVHTGPDFLARMLHEHPGNVVVISGRNKGKIERMKQADVRLKAETIQFICASSSGGL